MTNELATTRASALPGLPPEVRTALDVTIGVAGMGVAAAVVAVRAAHRVTAPVTRLLWHPPLVPRRLHPAALVAEATRAGRAEQVVLRRRVEVLLDAWAPVLVEAIIERVDVTRLVGEHVDLDALVATVDLDAAVARVDLDAVIDRIDLDAIAAGLDVDAVVARADLDAAVARVDIEAVLDRVDLDAVASRLDVDAVVARADLDAAVARVDIEAVLDRVDLDAVAAKLDVDAVVARADLDKVIDRIDIVGLVEEVLDVIDLPAIIRDSTGSMASETVRGVRMTGISADDALSRVVDRALLRRRRRESPGAAPHETPGGAP